VTGPLASVSGSLAWDAIVRLLGGLVVCVTAQLGTAWAVLGVSAIRRWAPVVATLCTFGFRFARNVLWAASGHHLADAVVLYLWARSLEVVVMFYMRAAC
jgi:hypothetical protein